MHEIVAALIEDTAEKLPALTAAFAAADADQVARLAHSSKGACANVGAESAAALFLYIEQGALRGDLTDCTSSLAALAVELERLRDAAATL
jgi:HPt (histidine-containing phosphotransfer) domain-containing protein